MSRCDICNCTYDNPNCRGCSTYATELAEATIRAEEREGLQEWLYGDLYVIKGGIN